MLLLIVPEVCYIDYILKETTYMLISEEYNLYQLEYKDKEFYILISDYGKLNIAIKLIHVINKYNISGVICGGICAIKPCVNIKLLDIIIPQLVLDTQNITLDNKDTFYYSDDEYNKKIKESLKNNNIKYFFRNILTSEEMIVDINNLGYLYDINILDYDLAYVGKVLENKKIPFSGIKIITYYLENNYLMQYNLYKDSAIMRMQKVFLNFLIYL